jgi:hypothetical protein
MFDISRPGEAGERYKTMASRKSKDGQKGPLIPSMFLAGGTTCGSLRAKVNSASSNNLRTGIISTLASDPARQGLLAAGSYSGQIALHDTNSSEVAPALIFNTTETTGVTQVKIPLPNQYLLLTVVA